MKLIFAIALTAVVMPAYAGRLMTLGDASAPARGETTLSLGFDSDDADAVGAEIRIPLPAGITYVEGSVQTVSDRMDGQTVSARQSGSELVIVVFNMDLTPIKAGKEEIVRFRLNGGRTPGIFTLTPQVKLSNAEGSLLPCDAISGKFTVEASRIDVSPETISYGRVPIRGSYTRDFTVSNTGTTTLHVSGINVKDSPEFGFEPSAFDVEAGDCRSVVMTYSPVDYADGIEKTVEIFSDASNGTAELTVQAIPYSVNTVGIVNVSGTGGEEVTVSVTMQNMEPIVGADMVFELPEQLQYVDGSVKTSGRSSMLGAKGSLSGDRLRVILYGISNEAMTGNEGEIMSFKVRLKGSTGIYWIAPQNVKLANARGRNMVSGTQGGYITIQSPRISGSSTFDSGNLPSNVSNEVAYEVANVGESPLTIDHVTFLAEGFSVEGQLPMTLPAGESGQIWITIAPRTPGSYSTVMNIYSNDPSTPLFAVDMKGTAHSPNDMSFKGVLSDNNSEYVVTGSLDNDAPIVALQMDVRCDPSMTTSRQQLLFTDRASSHQSSFSKISEGLYRMILFSFDNTPIAGNSGPLFTLVFNGDNMEGKEIRFENIKLSTASGQNFTTPGGDTHILTVESHVSVGMEEISNTGIRVEYVPDGIIVHGIEKGIRAVLYGMDGIVHADVSADETGTAYLRAKSGIYLLTVGSTTMKTTIR